MERREARLGLRRSTGLPSPPVGRCQQLVSWSLSANWERVPSAAAFVGSRVMCSPTFALLAAARHQRSRVVRWPPATQTQKSWLHSSSSGSWFPFWSLHCGPRHSFNNAVRSRPAGKVRHRLFTIPAPAPAAPRFGRHCPAEQNVWGHRLRRSRVRQGHRTRSPLENRIAAAVTFPSSRPGPPPPEQATRITTSLLIAVRHSCRQQLRTWRLDPARSRYASGRHVLRSFRPRRDARGEQFHRCSPSSCGRPLGRRRRASQP